MKHGFLFVISICLCSFPFSLMEVQSQEKERVLQREKIGVIYNRLSSRVVKKDEAKKDLEALLRKKTSELDSEDTKLDVVEIKKPEDARKRGIRVVFYLDYREEAGKYISGTLNGYATSFFCTFKRADQNSEIATNWDNLSITESGVLREVDRSGREVNRSGGGGFMISLSGKIAEEVLRKTGFLGFANEIPVLVTSLRKEGGTEPQKAGQLQQSEKPLVTSQPEQKESDPQQSASGQDAIPTAAGVYYESPTGFKPLGSFLANEKDVVILPSKLPSLVVVYPKDSVHIEGLRLGSESGFTLTLGTSGGGIGFTDLSAPERVEPVPGNAHAFRVTFNQRLRQDRYALVSKYLDKEDGKEKVVIHAGFRVR